MKRGMSMPDIAKQLVEQITAAAADKTALEITGGGSKNGILSRDISGQELKVSGHSGIVSYDATELVLTARAGTLLVEIEQELAQNGQMLSFEPPHLGKNATIGGTLACNLSGPGRPWGGSIRDMALGVRLINGRGQHLRFGGQVMKNVAGYDVTRLQAGALGSLGVITEISLKVLPRAEYSVTLSWRMDQAAAIEKMNALAATPKPLSGALWLGGVLYIRLAGAEKAVKATIRAWGGEELSDHENFWRDIREQSHAFFSGDAPLWRFSIIPTAPPLFAANAMLLDWGGGQRWLHGDFQLARLQEVAGKAGGHVTLFRGGDRGAEIRQPLSGVQKKLHMRLKKAFDPQGILNPGSLYGWM